MNGKQLSDELERSMFEFVFWLFMYVSERTESCSVNAAAYGAFAFCLVCICSDFFRLGQA